MTWESLSEDVETYRQTCESCQKNKNKIRLKQELLQTIIPNHVVDLLLIDYVGPLPATGLSKIKFVLLITDCVSRFVSSYQTAN